MEIKLIATSSDDAYRDKEIREIWWKTYWAAITGKSSKKFYEVESVINEARIIANKTIEMVSPGTKMKG